LADAVLRQGRPEEAEAFHKRALVIRENALGARIMMIAATAPIVDSLPSIIKL
jgi:hypothetical protein